MNKKTELFDKEIHNYYRNKFRRVQRRSINAIRNTNTDKINKKFKQNILAMWEEIKVTTRTKNDIQINIETLKDHYRALFNSTSQNVAEERELYDKIRTVKEKEGDVFISENKVESILNGLKCNKATGISGISNEMYKYAERPTLVQIVQLILMIIINKHIMPQIMNVGLMFPLLKDQKGANSELKNTRPITLSEVIDCILETYFLESIDNSYTMNRLQFGFNKMVSAQHAIFMLKETILYQLAMKLIALVIFLDFSQAFDKVNKTKLLLKLYGIMNKHTWLTLVNYSRAATVIVKNKNELTEKIIVNTGVKQGGPASPRLFSIYINSLINELEDSGYLCKIHGSTTGVICYADDIALICNNEKDAQQALNIVERYCREHEIKVNTEKTKWMHFGNNYQMKKSSKMVLTINDTQIEKVGKFKYLGYWLTNNLSDNYHIKIREDMMLKSAFATNKLEYNNINLDIKIRRLFHTTYIRSKLLYSIENTNLNKQQIKKITNMDSMIIKKGLSINKYSSLSKTLAALNLETLETLIEKRKLNFVLQLISNDTTNEVITGYQQNRIKPEKRSILHDVINTVNQTDTTLETEILRKLARIDATNNGISTEEIEIIRELLAQRNRRNNGVLETLLQRS